MFRRLRESGVTDVPVTIDGRVFSARAGDSVAAALLAAGVAACRTTTVSGAERGPFCLMGVCFDCLVTIDGRINQQACLISIRAGMRIERQSGRPRVVDTAQPA
jgi:predicted molibdopterin-dependent oxidoreductase YjgC